MATFKPYPYQQYAIDRCIHNPILGLFLDMGMGKTVITLTALDQLLYDYYDVSKVLVIAPLRVVEDTWTKEAAKWDHTKHLKVSRVLGSEKERLIALRTHADIYAINRENVVWLVEQYGRDWPFDMVVIDELSSFKSNQAKRFKALKKVRPLIKRIIGLTGTPSPNNLLDLWPQLYLLDRGKRLGKTITGYRDQYFTPGAGNGMVVYNYELKPGAEEAIHTAISDICVSMTAKDYLELPPRLDNIVRIKLSQAEMKLYKKLEKEKILEFQDSVVTAGSAAVLSNKLLQLANGAIYDEDHNVETIHAAKLKALEDIIEAAQGKPVLVFYSYKHDLARIQHTLRAYKPVKLETSEDIDNWSLGKIQVLLAHPASAGHGLNLQAGGNIIVWFGHTWSLELYQQANARLHRQGQTETVVIHHLVTEGTMDESVMSALENKAVGQEALIEAVKARLEEYENGN